MASQTNSGSDLGFEADLFKAADKLWGNLEPSEYKHVAPFEKTGLEAKFGQ